MKLLKTMLLSIVGVTGLTVSSTSFADDFGCKAVLCFAGGKGVSECQSTIREVKKRLAKGKGFPHCSFVSSNGADQSLVNQSGVFTRRVKAGQKCPDGTPSTYGSFGTGICKAITVTFKGTNEDGSDHTQEINW